MSMKEWRQRLGWAIARLDNEIEEKKATRGHLKKVKDEISEEINTIDLPVAEVIVAPEIVFGFNEPGTTPPVPPPAIPDAPSDLVATADGLAVDLTWTDNATNEDYQTLERSVGGGAFSTLSTLNPNVTSHRDINVSDGIEYTYRILAGNTGGESAYSNTASATPTAPDPDPGVDPIWSKDLRNVTMAEITGGGSDWAEVIRPELMEIDSQGLKQTWPSRPPQGGCSDFSISANPKLDQEYREIFFRAKIKFSVGWTTLLEGCNDSRNNDHKVAGLRVRNFGGGTSGASRFGLLIGNGPSFRFEYSAPHLVGGPNQQIFSGMDARVVAWDNDWHEIAIWGLCSSAENVADGGGGFWYDGVLKGFSTGLVVNRRGIYASFLSRNLNEGPEVSQSMWWQIVDMFDTIPAGYATS